MIETNHLWSVYCVTTGGYKTHHKGMDLRNDPGRNLIKLSRSFGSTWGIQVSWRFQNPSCNLGEDTDASAGSLQSSISTVLVEFSIRPVKPEKPSKLYAIPSMLPSPHGSVFFHHFDWSVAELQGQRLQRSGSVDAPAPDVCRSRRQQMGFRRDCAEHIWTAAVRTCIKSDPPRCEHTGTTRTCKCACNNVHHIIYARARLQTYVGIHPG